MACMEHFCTNPKCNWADGSNYTIVHCPVCGARVINTFDEDPREHEREHAAVRHADDDVDDVV